MLSEQLLNPIVLFTDLPRALGLGSSVDFVIRRPKIVSLGTGLGCFATRGSKNVSLKPDSRKKVFFFHSIYLPDNFY